MNDRLIAWLKATGLAVLGIGILVLGYVASRNAGSYALPMGFVIMVLCLVYARRILKLGH